MARTPEALIKPELLVWARQSAGFSLDGAAGKLRVSEDRLSSWETGETRPTIAQLRKAANLYKRPLAIFYLPEPPIDFQPLRDYRRVPDAQLGQLSPKLLAFIRRAHAVREAALELRDLTDEPAMPAPKLETDATDPERYGAGARALLGVTLAQQAAWRDPRRALNAWIDAVSNLDVLVLQAQSIPIQEMRGFSISTDRLPVVVLNGGDFPRGRIFTLLHEFAHVLLHADGVCDVLPRRQTRSPADDIEIFCNQVAAAALMPLDTFRSESALQKPPPDKRWSEETIRGLSEKYSTSREAVVRRLYSVGLADWDFLQEKEAEYRAAFAAFRDEQKRKRQEDERPGGPTYYRMKVRDLGHSFIESALDAYYRRAITGSDLSEYLEIKLDRLPKLEAELATTGGLRD
ncbi:MAG TPA: XRE family transcriptional regulator [Solirubrobacteraceae bacterium]|nr:XRE family transcriptional regulator [Solirubrobacteraceae bacterium]